MEKPKSGGQVAEKGGGEEGECVSVKEIDRDKSKGRERGCWDRRRRVIDRRSEEVGKKRKKTQTEKRK